MDSRRFPLGVSKGLPVSEGRVRSIGLGYGLEPLMSRLTRLNEKTTKETIVHIVVPFVALEAAK